MSALLQLQDWFLSQCNGEWEHGNAIVIETLDNPGWSVKIDLRGTCWEDAKLDELKVDRSANDWISCWKKGTEFVGYGDPTKLELILQRFLALVGSQSKRVE